MSVAATLCKSRTAILTMEMYFGSHAKARDMRRWSANVIVWQAIDYYSSVTVVGFPLKKSNVVVFF